MIIVYGVHRVSGRSTESDSSLSCSIGRRPILFFSRFLAFCLAAHGDATIVCVCVCLICICCVAFIHDFCLLAYCFKLKCCLCLHLLAVSMCAAHACINNYLCCQWAWDFSNCVPTTANIRWYIQWLYLQPNESSQQLKAARIAAGPTAVPDEVEEKWSIQWAEKREFHWIPLSVRSLCRAEKNGKNWKWYRMIRLNPYDFIHCFGDTFPLSTLAHPAPPATGYGSTYRLLLFYQLCDIDTHNKSARCVCYSVPSILRLEPPLQNLSWSWHFRDEWQPTRMSHSSWSCLRSPIFSLGCDRIHLQPFAWGRHKSYCMSCERCH